MSVVLSEHLPLLAAAPDGIQKLRGLILELAVRGKLVPQDPNDEPASELLKRIEQERSQLEREGKLRKAKTLPPLVEDEVASAVPKGWAWARLADAFAVVTDGDHLPPPKADTGIPFLVIGNLNSAQISFDGCRFVPQSYFENLDWSRRPTYGDLLYTVTGSFGIAIPVSTESPFCVQRHVAILKTTPSSPTSYLLHFLGSPQAIGYADTVATGIAQRTVTLSALRQMPIAIPPVAEQRRIVAKVDELMALCDRLEAEQADADSAHAKLVDTLLGTLTQSTDAADLAANWQRLAEHFDTLFTTESSLDALKQSILQLAVMGKLVPQDTNDEPASELLKRIAQERARLETEGACKKSKPMPPVRKDERPFEVPKDWEWERIGNYVFQTDYGLSEKTFELNGGVPVLKMGDIQGGNVILGGQKAVPPTTEGLPYLLLEPDDLLYNRTNSAELVGKTGIFRGQPQQFSFASYLIRIRCAKGMVSPTYLNLAMNAPMFRETEIVPHLKQQCGQANVNGTILRNMRIPVPPAAEQHRIVAKVDELMTLCDRLRSALTESRRRQGRLASTLIESALKAA